MSGNDYGVFYVEVKMNGRWTLFRQYKRRSDATLVAKDCLKNGLEARVRKG